MAVTMGVQHIIGTENARKSAADDRMVEHLAQSPNPGQQIVAGVAFLLVHLVQFLQQFLVKLLGKIRFQNEKAFGNKLAHLIVCQQYGRLTVHARYLLSIEIYCTFIVEIAVPK
ncbi:hypothetical protein PACILC2_04570 [Paenibacillus cisolokensis]|uniref:Uncharacterized protein n=1 Tax=Paenibacillus cisolokensis TaxID=1658519 RepID=A0ABQ4N152_9BACL|nr:hypothetical protein [Paenibacillus cisolokensis]GIQ61889.1 hypothetical protein PACILC2_04570 [Paenibacillus cisolokensis]